MNVAFENVFQKKTNIPVTSLYSSGLFVCTFSAHCNSFPKTTTLFFLLQCNIQIIHAHNWLFYSVSTWFFSVANSKEVNPSQDLVGNNSSVLSSTSLAQLHNVSNLPKHAAFSHTIYTFLFLASNEITLIH